MITIKNSGTAVTNISSFSLQKSSVFEEGEEWPIINHTKLEPGQIFELPVDFIPTNEESYESKIIYEIDGKSSSILLKGCGREAMIQISATLLHFNDVLIGNEYIYKYYRYTTAFSLVNACDMSFPTEITIVDSDILV